jgi:hypothetical protein
MTWASILTGRAPLVELPTGNARRNICADDEADEDADLALFGMQRRYGHLQVLRMADSLKGIRWWCLCDCGTTKAVYGSKMKDGSSKSCGCRGRW